MSQLFLKLFYLLGSASCLWLAFTLEQLPVIIEIVMFLFGFLLAVKAFRIKRV